MTSDFDRSAGAGSPGRPIPSTTDPKTLGEASRHLDPAGQVGGRSVMSPEHRSTDDRSQERTETGSSSTKETFQREAQSARETAGAAGERIRDAAGNFTDTAREHLNRQAESGKEAVSSGIADFAAAIRKASEELGERDQSMAAQLVRQAASGLEQATDSIKGRDLGEIAHSVSGFARRQPAAFIIGAALAGVALGRLVRASAPSSSGASASETHRAPQGGGYRTGSSTGLDRSVETAEDIAGPHVPGRPMTGTGGPGSVGTGGATYVR